MIKWFYSEQQVVKGPFAQNDLQIFLQKHPNPAQVFVWSRGLTEWISGDRWTPTLVNQMAAAAPNLTRPQAAPPAASETMTSTIPMSSAKPMAPPKPSAGFARNVSQDTLTVDIESTALGEENTQTVTDVQTDSAGIDPDLMRDIENKSVEKYRVQLQFVDQPMMTRDELMTFISAQDDVSQVSIYDKKSNEWKEVYAFREIVDKLGLTRRKHPRVPILAQFMGSTNRHSHFTARVVTISIGGLGLTDVFDLKIGDHIKGQMTSPHFYSPVHFEAEVTYAGQDGYVGFKFTQINDDALSLVTDYVNRFSQTQS